MKNQDQMARRKSADLLAQRLYETAFVKPKKLAFLKHQKEDEEMKECVFHPQINKKSRILDMMRGSPKKKDDGNIRDFLENGSRHDQSFK